MRMARRSFFAGLADDDPSAAEMVTFPISAHLIEGPSGRVLFDTGCHPDAMKPNGRWSDVFKRRLPWSPGPDGEACHLPNRLEQLGLGPDDIRHVVLSHMHSDHAGCVEFFRKSQIIVHRAELDAARDRSSSAHSVRASTDSSFRCRPTRHSGIARNAPGETIRIPRYGFNASRWSSPLTIQSLSESRANARNRLSFGSRNR